MVNVGKSAIHGCYGMYTMVRIWQWPHNFHVTVVLASSLLDLLGQLSAMLFRAARAYAPWQRVLGVAGGGARQLQLARHDND